ncbi:unnamed protein product, partial [Iphiclides podalirius]
MRCGASQSLTQRGAPSIRGPTLARHARCLRTRRSARKLEPFQCRTAVSHEGLHVSPRACARTRDPGKTELLSSRRTYADFSLPQYPKALPKLAPTWPLTI